MILSAKYKYIYIRPRKTGSTTIQRVLASSVGPDDVIVTSETRSLGMLQAPSTEIPGDLLNTHMPVAEIRPFIRDEFWSSAFKFASVRHPYEKAVSLAYFRLGKRERQRRRGGIPKNSFEEYLDVVVRQGGGFDDHSLYTVDGQVILDDVIRHESLEADLRRIGDRLGFPVPAELPDAKSAHRSDRRPAREILSEEQRQAIYAARRAEFDYFNYEP